MYRKIVILILLVGSVILSGCKEEAEMVEPFIILRAVKPLALAMGI